MNDPIMNEGVWPTWLQQAMWLEWVQPFLYALLALALVSLVLALLDLALLSWKEFHPKTTPASAKVAPVRPTGRTSDSPTPVRFAKRKDRSKVIMRLTKAGAIHRGFQPHQPRQQTTAKR